MSLVIDCPRSALVAAVLVVLFAVPAARAGAAAPAPAAPAGGVHLFILSGQSNMAGLDPALSFTPAVEEAFGKDNVIVVKDAQGGEPIRRWYKQWAPKGGKPPATNGDLYDRLIGKVKPAIEGKTLASVTFVWMQGERDAKEKHGEVYAESLKGLLEQLRTDLKRKDIGFVIGRLSDFDLADKSYPHWTMIRKAQVETAEAAEAGALGAWVDTDDLNGEKNDLHYTKPAGYKELGARFAAKAIELARKASGAAGAGGASGDAAKKSEAPAK